MEEGEGHVSVYEVLENGVLSDSCFELVPFDLAPCFVFITPTFFVHIFLEFLLISAEDFGVDRVGCQPGVLGEYTLVYQVLLQTQFRCG
jgi:hypothetical protein